jgi:hypothetical protein
MRLAPLSRSPVAPLAAAAVWLGLVAGLVAPFAMSGDAPHYLTATHSLIADGDLDLRNDYDTRSHAPFYAGSLEPRHTNTSPWGEHYPFHGIGVSVLAAPGYWLAGARGATAMLVLVLSLGAGIVWCTVRAMTSSVAAAWFAWATLVAAAPYALHAAAIYPDGPAAVAVAGALWLLARLEDDAAVPIGAFAAAGAGLAALPWLHVRLSVPAAILGAAVLVAIARRQPDPWTRAAWFAAVPAISFAALMASAYVMFGTWNPAAAMAQRTAPNAFGAAPAGVLGLLADQEFGLLPAAPVFLAAPMAFVAAWRRAATLAMASGIAAVLVLVMSSLWVWWGGDSAPARFLVVLVPALGIWLGVYWARSGPGVRQALAVGLAFTLGSTWLLASVDGGAHAFNYPDGKGSVFATWSAVVDASAALPSMFRPGATFWTEVPVAVTWAVGALGAALAFAWIARRSHGRTVVAGAVALVAMVATTAVAWQVRGVDPWTPGTAHLAVLAALAADDAVAIAGRWPQPASPTVLARRLVLRTPESVPPDEGVALYVPNVPAGTYVIRLRTWPDPAGVGTAYLGRDASPYAAWDLRGSAPTLTLATGVHSIRVTTPRGSVSDAWLEPATAPRRPRFSQARRVTRLGAVDVYGLDDSTYPESDGLWTGGNRPAALLLAAAARYGVRLGLTAGPADVSVDIDAGARRERVSLPARTSTGIAVGTIGPLEPLAITVTTDGGFPARMLRDGDSRTLGVWVTFATTPIAGSD